ncbi:formylglycine-generating enzyme family protein [Paucibacter sp. R3-3]|uniref:Formylglycine-generating enzyme family protein n=1 Tax=Roseateles agri TaxID=3098619 RepID=A0ABU5DHP1_9BURK|nr:formylglycine-generating enzyme family protein [Paucibacter sp. R3-3]MDY0745810.1 formylglycine-generating enzyme family protein [Paucibacter sp. R3-3]
MPRPLQIAAAAVLAAAATVAVAVGWSEHRELQRFAATPLGNETRCEAYAGLPPGWGGDKHAGMVQVPAGSFHFGSTQGYPDERPGSTAPLPMHAFWIDRTEVTIAQFSAFVHATGYVTEAERQGGAVVFHQPTDQELGSRPYAWWTFVQGADWRHPGGPGSSIAKGMDHLPVTFVTEADALAYARWLGRDLPTEQEWEYAGKAGREGPELDTAPRGADGRPTANYWQGAFPAFDAKEDGHAGLAPVGCYAANDWGLHDMIGNVWEWTKDGYGGPHQGHMNGDTAVAAAQTAPGGHKPDRPMVIKGGSYLCSPDFCVRYRASARESQEADLATAHIGFRTVLRERSS